MAATTTRNRDPLVHAYLRKSTIDQAESLEVQRQAASGLARQVGLPDPESSGGFYCDPATSGRSKFADREAGRALNSRLKAGDTLIIAKLDRAFRNLADAAVTLDEWVRRGVRLYVCDLGTSLDLQSPIGKLVVQILCAFAELEATMISTRTREGLASMKKRGTKYCRHAGYGKRWHKSKVDGQTVWTRVENDAERDVMRRIVHLRSSDPPWSWDQIRLYLKEHGIKTEDQTVKKGDRILVRPGQFWDISRIRRAYEAELQLRLEER